MKQIDIITGTRPNFMKVAPIIRCLQQDLNKGGVIAYRLIHTGQHTDPEMYHVFLDELQMPLPDIDLNVGACPSPEYQLEAIMLRYERVLQEQRPDILLVVGDCTSALACALAARKTSPDIILVHVEAGIRCGDMEMPEELNRIAIDALCDYFFTTSERASRNLLECKVSGDRIFFAGNTMIDTLKTQLHRLRRPPVADMLQLKPQQYLVLTLHRRANIGSPVMLGELISCVAECARGLPVIFPLHPHTARQLPSWITDCPNLHIVPPMGYLEFNYLVREARAVVTDSGGVTEEATVLGVPCITLRDRTERPETCDIGTNVLAGTQASKIRHTFNLLFTGAWKSAGIPDRWDGKAAERIVRILGDNCMEKPLLAHGKYRRGQ